jgi:hypothetical protein
MDTDGIKGKFSFPAEILPDNDRTAEIMKKRQEEDEIKK